jgi:uncharacterized protein YndB with AHSA1/START domain
LVIADSVEREVLIEAPPRVVWRVLTEPEHIQRWFADEVSGDLRPGGRGSLTWNRMGTKQPSSAEFEVVALDPPRRFAYRWDFPPGERAREGNSMLVEFTLTEEGGNTRLRVVESGLGRMRWSEGEKATYAEDHGKGWEIHLERFRSYAPTVASGSAR